MRGPPERPPVVELDGRGMKTMDFTELEQRVSELRTRPLLLRCRLPNGREVVLTVADAAKTGATYIHIIADDLDELLTAGLGGWKPPKTEDKKEVVNHKAEQR